MPLYFDNTKIMTPQYNGTNLSVVKIDGKNVFKKGNVNFTFNLTSQDANLNSYASYYYVRITNERTGVTKTVGGHMGATSVSIPAMDGDTITFHVDMFYSGILKPIAPLKDGMDNEDAYEISYPLNDTDISFTASFQIKGYYNPEFGKWYPYEGVNGTITANYYVPIEIVD